MAGALKDSQKAMGMQNATEKEQVIDVSKKERKGPAGPVDTALALVREVPGAATFVPGLRDLCEGGLVVFAPEPCFGWLLLAVGLLRVGAWVVQRLDRGSKPPSGNA